MRITRMLFNDHQLRKDGLSINNFHICRWLDLDYDPIESLDFGEAMLSVAFSEHGYIRMGVWNRTVDLFLEQRGEL